MDVNSTLNPVSIIDSGQPQLHQQLMACSDDALAVSWPSPFNQKPITAFRYALSIGHIEAIQSLIMKMPHEHITAQWSEWQANMDSDPYWVMINAINQDMQHESDESKGNYKSLDNDMKWLYIPPCWMARLSLLVGRDAACLRYMQHDNMFFYMSHWSYKVKAIQFPQQQWPMLSVKNNKVTIDFIDNIASIRENSSVLHTFRHALSFFFKSLTFSRERLSKQAEIWHQILPSHRPVWSSMLRTALLGEQCIESCDATLGSYWRQWWFDKLGDRVDVDFKHCLDSAQSHDTYSQRFLDKASDIAADIVGRVTRHPDAASFLLHIRSASVSFIRSLGYGDLPPFATLIRWHSFYMIDVCDEEAICLPFDEEGLEREMSKVRMTVSTDTQAVSASAQGKAP